MFWNLENGSIIKKFELENVIVGLRKHPTERDRILVLTKNGELSIFSQEKLEKKIVLNAEQSTKQKLILLIG